MVNDALHDNGSPGGAWSTGKQPSDGQPLSYSMVPNFEDYGPGALHPAGSEVYYLVPDPVADTKAVSAMYNPDISETALGSAETLPMVM